MEGSEKEPSAPPRRKSLRKSTRTVSVLKKKEEKLNDPGLDVSPTEKPLEKPPPPHRPKQPTAEQQQKQQQNVIKKPPKKPPLPQNSVKKTPGRPPNPKTPQKTMETNEQPQTKPKPVPRPRVERPVPAPRRQASHSFSDSEEKTRTLSKTSSIEMPEVPEFSEEGIECREENLKTEPEPVNNAECKLESAKETGFPATDDNELIESVSESLHELEEESPVDDQVEESSEFVPVKQQPLKRNTTDQKNENATKHSYENVEVKSHKQNPYANVMLKNEATQFESEVVEDIYSAPSSTFRLALSGPQYPMDDGIYSAPSSNPTLEQNSGAYQENLYSAPTSTLSLVDNDMKNNNFNSLHSSHFVSAEISNKPVIPYSMLRPDEPVKSLVEEIVYSNIDDNDRKEAREENLYSAQSSSPNMSDVIGSIPDSTINRTSTVSTSPDNDTYQVPSPQLASRENKYEEMIGSLPKRQSQYETIFPSNSSSPVSSPSKTDIQKRTLPPRPPRPKSLKKFEAKDEQNPNLYQSVESLRRDDAIVLQREGLSSDSDSDSDGYVSLLDEKKVDFQDKSKLFYIAYEILTTEKSFVEALSLICEDFGNPLKQAMERNPRLLPEGAYSQMFMNIELIYELDKKFLHDLEERMENWELHKRIGDLVREYGHFLKMYTTYIKGYDNAMAVYHDCINTNLKFSQLVKDFEKSKKAKNLKLTSYLLKPIQRIPSYRLLLKDYLKYLPEDSLDFNDVRDSVVIVSEVANYINESMKEGEKFQEVLRIQSQIVNANDIIKPGRFLLKEGTLMKLSRKELQQRTFILFTDSLLYCAHIGHGQLKLILELPLAGMLVQYPDSQELSTEFSVISTKRSFLLNASSPKEREDWVAALEDAICVVNTKLGSFTIKRTEESIALQQIRSDLGMIAPPWIPDSRVTMCQVCTEQFNVYNRRHHCRGCGKVVCKTCSGFEAPLKYMENESARVCEKCYETLLESVKASEDEQHLVNKFKETKAKKKPKKRMENLPSTLTEIEAQQEGIENSGFLKLKRGGKKEKRCWFVLKEHVLYVYKASSDPAASTTIPILGYELDITGNWADDDFGFQLSHAGVKENLTFHAENRSSAERWVHCFCKATALLNT